MEQQRRILTSAKRNCLDALLKFRQRGIIARSNCLTTVGYWTPKANIFQVHGAPQHNLDRHFHSKFTENNAKFLVVFITGSIPEIWDQFFDKMATYMGPNGRDGLSRYQRHYDHLNTALMKNDNHGVVKLFHKYLAIEEENVPLYNDKEFLMACNGKTDINTNRNNMLMLIQNLSTNTGSNITFLQTMNNFFKPLANHINHVLATYHCKTNDACQGKPKN